MRLKQSSTLRLAIITCTTVGSVSASFLAAAACTDTNTCLGTGALELHVDGNDNSAFGFQALGSDVHGSKNTAVGAFALSKNVGHFTFDCDFFGCTGGIANTAVGTSALRNNTTGGGNAATGFQALSANTTGTYNVAMGARSLEANRTGANNTAVGGSALEVNTTGSSNTAIGSFALWASTEAGSNTAVGFRALMGFNWDGADRYRQQGNSNSAFGESALRENDTGDFNTALGYGALNGSAFDGMSGSFNTASGARSLRANSSGSENTAVGFDSLHSNNTGARNTAHGFNALGGVTTGVRNTAIGAAAGKNVTTGSDNIIIGAEVFGGAAQNGAIRIGNSAYQKKAFIAGIRGVQTGSSTASAVFIDANGQLGTIKSSSKVKEDIQPMGSASDRLLALRPVTFRYRESYNDGTKPVEFGLIAEEVAEVFPELVIYDESGQPETVAYHLLASLLLNEFQKAYSVIEDQSARISMLEAQSADVAQLKKEFVDMAAAIEKRDHARIVATTQ